MRHISFIFLLILPVYVCAQHFDMQDKARINRMKEDISLLASDSLLGREAGTKGEIMAMHYLADKFKEIKLNSILEDGTYFQEFDFVAGATYEHGTSLQIGNRFLKMDNDYFPLSYSASAKAGGTLIDMGYGMETGDPATNDYSGRSDIKGKVFLMEAYVPGGARNYEKYSDQAKLKHKIKTAEKHGAAAVIFVNNDPDLLDPENNISLRVVPANIPVVFVKGEAGEHIKQMEGESVKLSVNIRKIRKSAYNVAGLIDNGAKYTVVLGAHYDHLGMGGPSSRYPGQPQVHNGADDNASGVAAILEVARSLKNENRKDHNYLIIAFSAEEHGLIGSSCFTESGDYNLNQITAMINFDMIGRMRDSIMHIIGTGTTRDWEDMIEKSNEDQKLKLKTSKDGSGGSDQTSFYLNDIPVLFCFTGTHDDYHKPSDDEYKINYPGMLMLIRHVEDIIAQIPADKKLEFVETESKKQSRPTRFSVTLGVMPDHTFEGVGMRIANVINGRTADNAGLKDGDIVLQMGEYEVTDMMSYMKALSGFNKGNKVKVKIRRKNKILEKEVQFK